MNSLPVIPSPSSNIRMCDVLAVETSVANTIGTIDDVDLLDDMRRKTDALANWLRGKELHGPMLGAERRIEARIGQLLGDAEAAQLNGKPLTHELKVVSPMDRVRFRQLSRGFGLLKDEEWRQSRTALIAFLQEKYPVPKRQPAIVVEKNGRVKKSRKQRANEIGQLASVGYRAAQIADELGISEEQVRNVARAETITLPDAALAKSRKIDPHRVVETIVTGLEGTVISLRTIGTNLSGISVEEASTWIESLNISISQLKRLRSALQEIVRHGTN